MPVDDRRLADQPVLRGRVDERVDGLLQPELGQVLRFAAPRAETCAPKQALSLLRPEGPRVDGKDAHLRNASTGGGWDTTAPRPSNEGISGTCLGRDRVSAPPAGYPGTPRES